MEFLTDVSGSGVRRASRTCVLALQIRASTCQQFQDVVGQARACRGRSSQPKVRPQLVRVERSLLGRLGKMIAWARSSSPR